MTTLKKQVADAAKGVAEDPNVIDCVYQPHVGGERWNGQFGPPMRCTFAELPEREFDDGYGGRDGEPFIGFSDFYVYVCGTYDGSEWVQAIPRSLGVAIGWKDLPVVGGG